MNKQKHSPTYDMNIGNALRVIAGIMLAPVIFGGLIILVIIDFVWENFFKVLILLGIIYLIVRYS